MKMWCMFLFPVNHILARLFSICYTKGTWSDITGYAHDKAAGQAFPVWWFLAPLVFPMK